MTDENLDRITSDRASLKIAPEARLSLRDHVRQRIRMAIISGAFAPGQRLNERQLAEDLDVSTTPLKEALRQLEAEGLVEVMARRGLVVRFNETFAEEMILARAALESPIAALAARRADSEGRQRLQATVGLMQRATQAADIDELIALNETFHSEIHALSRTVHLVRMVAQQQFYDDSARRVIHQNKGESDKALNEHRNICDAIVAGDPEGAGSAMRAHVLRSGRLYLASVFGTKGESFGID